MYERSIKYGLNKVTGELLDADVIFSKTKEAFALKKQFILEKQVIHCRECDQELFITTSKYDRLHFRHSPQSEPCLLKQDNLTVEENEAINKIIAAKESPRHKYLKNKIGELALKTPAVDPESIQIDDKFIIVGDEKKRPDVYFSFKNNRLAFEIQLSALPLKYILDRQIFYSKNGIYLIWILDDFNVHGQTQTERDIKYLYSHQNFFKLDEQSEDILQLLCDFKKPFLTSENELRDKWKKKSVTLECLTFDPNTREVYYFDLLENSNLVEARQKKAVKEIRQRQKAEKRKQKLELEKAEVEDILTFMRALYKNDHLPFDGQLGKLIHLNEHQIKLLNKKLSFKNKMGSESGRPFIIEMLLSQRHPNFLQFVLSAYHIEKDVNTPDEEGISALHHVVRSEYFPYREIMVKSLFKSGYELTEADKAFFEEQVLKSTNKLETEQQYLRIQFYDRLKGRGYYIDRLTDIEKVLYTLQSIRDLKIHGFNLKNFIALANNAIEYYPKYWVYIENALKVKGLWDIIHSNDTKKSFQKKLAKHKSLNVEYDFRNHWMINILFPKLTKEVNPNIF
jgi:competence CoiA-like predicted nuclease